MSELSPLPDILITQYLEMTDRAQFVAAYVDDPAMALIRAKSPDIAFYRFMYREVGYVWRWRDRNYWTDEKLHDALERSDLHYMLIDGNPAGFVELGAPEGEDRAIEITLFGLRQPYFGRGLGKHLLSFGIERAWEIGAGRVTVHTCNLDGPHALVNYQRRGFVVCGETREPMPDRYKV